MKTNKLIYSYALSFLCISTLLTSTASLFNGDFLWHLSLTYHLMRAQRAIRDKEDLIHLLKIRNIKPYHVVAFTPVIRYHSSQESNTENYSFSEVGNILDLEEDDYAMIKDDNYVYIPLVRHVQLCDGSYYESGGLVVGTRDEKIARKAFKLH